MNNIKSSWDYVTLQEIVDEKKHSIKRGPWGSSLKKEFFVKNGYKVYEQKNVIYQNFKLGNYYIDDQKFQELKDFELFPGDLVINCSGTFGKIAIVPDQIEKGIINQALLKISFDHKKILTSYIKYLFQSENIQKIFFGLTHGSAIKNIVSISIIKKMKFEIPPINEQQKIASILSKVDELIQKREQIIEQTQRLKKGLIQRLLTKGIGHTKFKKTKLGEIPEEWNIEILGNVLSICQYGLSLALSEKGTFPIFRMNNIENGYMITNDMKYIDLDQKLFEQFKLEKDDILINRTNSIDLVGKLGIFLLEGNYTFASYLIRMRTIKEKILPFFLNIYLNSQKMQYKLKSLATAGVSQANINAVNLKNLQIPLPSLSEQQKIITIILKIDDIFKKTRREKDVLLDLKKSLMQQLLTGKIRVKV